MHIAEYLHLEDRFSDDAAVPAYFFWLYVGAADVAFQLNFDELGFYNETKHFDNVSNNAVGWDCFDQLDRVFSFKISQWIFHLSNNLKVLWWKLQLSVDIDLVWNLTQGFSHQQHVSFLNCVFEIDSFRVFNKKSYFWFIICWF